MGIVKISDQMHENLRVSSGALSRSINAQAEHWLRIGMLTELNPHLNHHDINRLLVQLSHQGGLALAQCLTPSKQALATTEPTIEEPTS